jgi:predicted DNA-binding transcriptional regulator AlpA
MSISSTESLGYLRIWDIIGDKKRGISPLFPVGRTTWLNGVKEGKYPKPVKLGERITVWKRADILQLLESMSGAS